MTAKEEDALPTREEVEQICAVPDQRIAWDVKRDLALQYLDYIEDEDPEECGFKDEAERNAFRDKMKQEMKISEGDINANNFVGGMTSSVNPWGDNLEDDIQQAYSKAKDAYDKVREEDRQGDQKAVSDGKAALDNISYKASATNPGAGSSDEILDTGLSGMKCFDIFMPLYNRAVAKVGGAPGDLGEIKRHYDEQRKIPFAKFSVGADEFTKLKDSVASSLADVSGELNSSLASWQGAASEQAKRYQQGYEKQTKAVADAGEHAATAMLTAIGSVGKFCREKADWVLKYSFDRIGEVTAQDLERIIRIAELEGNASQDDFKHCVKFLDAESQTKISDEDCDLNDDTINYIVDQVRAYLRNFCSWFSKHLDNFRLMCSNTRTAVDGVWKALADFLLSLPENAYADVGKEAEESKPKGNGGNQGGGGPGSGSGGSVPSGGAVAPPAMPKPPEIPPPPEIPKPPEMPNPETPDTNTNPVTHQPLETDPSTGKPYPIDPVTGVPIKDAVPERDSMTVQQGVNKISMEEPGQDGKMGISLDDGTGQPKDYQLDFGDDKALPLADGTPDQGPQGPIPPVIGQGAEDQGTGEKAYQPGSDGKIHIEDGGVKITAERPSGPDGQTVITVDDGKSEPTKYTLGDQDTRSIDEPTEAASADAGESTSAQSVAGSMSGSSLFDSGPAMSGVVDGGLGDTSSASTDFPDDATSQSAPGLGNAPGGTSMGQGAGGMGMMGGMGAAGGGGGGEEQERSASTYRVDGGLFDTAAAGGRISGSLDDDSTISSR